MTRCWKESDCDPEAYGVYRLRRMSFKRWATTVLLFLRLMSLRRGAMRTVLSWYCEMTRIKQRVIYRVGHFNSVGSRACRGCLEHELSRKIKRIQEQHTLESKIFTSKLPVEPKPAWTPSARSFAYFSREPGFKSS